MNQQNNPTNKDEYIIKNLGKNKRKIYKPVPLLDGIEEIKSDIQERLKEGDVTYGLEILDDNVETIRKGSLTFIIAPPNVGKSNVGLTIARHLAKQDKLVLICSCEMGAGLLMERELRNLAGLSPKELKIAYQNSPDTAEQMLNNVYENDKYKYLQNISICETGGASVFDIIEMLEAFPEYEYVIIDYIQRIRGTGTEYENITEAARELQTFARRTLKPLIICSQANRQSQSDAKTKEGFDFTKIRGKGSGSIEEDGDVGISLAEQISEGQKYILMTLFKNRYGANKNITYRYRVTPRLQYEFLGVV